MKRNLLTMLVSLLLFTLSSCIISLRELADYDTITTDNKLTGSWLQSGKTLVVQKLEESSYKDIFAEARRSKSPFLYNDSIYATKMYIISFKENEIDYTWTASLVNIGANTFVSLGADGAKFFDKDVSPSTSLQGYSFARLEWQTANTLKLSFIDGEFVKEMVLADKARIGHEYDPLYGTFLITASADEMRSFLEKYGNDERLFKGGRTVNLVRKN